MPNHDALGIIRRVSGMSRGISVSFARAGGGNHVGLLAYALSPRRFSACALGFLHFRSLNKNAC